MNGIDDKDFAKSEPKARVQADVPKVDGSMRRTAKVASNASTLSRSPQLPKRRPEAAREL